MRTVRCFPVRKREGYSSELPVLIHTRELSGNTTIVMVP